MTSDHFGIEATVTNTGTIAYDEDFAFRCYRVTYDNYGTSIQTQSQALQLAPGESKVLQFDCYNVMDDFKYFAWLYYYSAGELIQARGTGIYTVCLPDEPQGLMGDVNGDGKVDVSDVNIVINIILGNDASTPTADVDNNNKVDVADINIIVNIILGKHETQPR